MSDINSDNGRNDEGELASGEPFTPGQWKAAYQQAETAAQRIALLFGYLTGSVPPVEEVQAALELLEEGMTEEAGDHQAVMEGEPAAPRAEAGAVGVVVIGAAALGTFTG